MQTNSTSSAMLTSPKRLQLEALRASVRAKEIRLKDISEATGVHISQVSRILAGQIKRTSPNVERICIFANHSNLQHNNNDSKEMIVNAAIDIWDGTNNHAIALTNLLNAINSYQKNTNNLPSEA
jgi:transcriptional regulator with XRE-family HTH domain